MIEPVKMADFFVTFFSAASVILFGALYALLFAYSRIRNVPRLMPLAYAAYAVLFASLVMLADVTNLFGSFFWMLVVMLMLAGYLAAPHAIWHLCVNTHAATYPKGSVTDVDHPFATPSDYGDPHTLQQLSTEKIS